MATATRLKKRLGGFLRELRDRAGTTLVQAAGELKTTDGTVSRYETGAVLPVWSTVSVLLTFYGATAKDRSRASQLFDDAKDEPRSIRLTAGAAKAFRKLVNAEREAVRERALAPLVIPGLLQTERYARALVEAGSALHDPNLRQDGVITTRMNRQKALDGPEPMVLHVLIDEAAIRREIGGRQVLREQLARLLDVAEWPNITLQAIPLSAGGYGTMNGSFVIVDYPEPDTTPDVYLEYPAGGGWVDNPKDVERFTTMFDAATRLAHTPAETADLIHRHARALRTK